MPRSAAKKSPARRPAPGQPARRAERAADRRQAIIEAAFETFIDQGYAATRLEDVARRAHVAVCYFNIVEPLGVR